DGPNRCIGIWTETRSANELGYAQGVSVGGLIGIRVATQGNVPAVITTPAGTLQMVDTIFPTTASQAVNWAIVPGTGNATISAGGLVTATASGTVYARAVAVQDVTVRDSLLINISGQAPTAPGVTTLAATNIQPTTATINGSVMANGSTTTVSFEWGTTTGYGFTAAATPATVTGNTATPVLANLNGLAMNTLYHFRCKGVNGIGTSYGADLTFSTGCNIPAGAAGPITGPANVCVNATGMVYSVAPVTNATGYQWTVPAGATIVSGQNTTSITVNFTTGSGTISVYGTNVCSAGTPANLAVTVLPFPVPAVTGSSNICLGSGLYTYSTETGMNNYAWTVSSGGTILAGAGTAVIQVQWNGSGAQTVSVSYSNAANCAATQPTVLPVNVNDLPGVAGVITGTPELCAGTSAVAYSVAPVTNAGAYVWTLPPGASIASGNLTSSITVDYSAGAASGDLFVVGNNTCGNGPPSPVFPVTVNPIPPTPTVTAIGPDLTSSAPAGNQWYYTDSPGGAGSPISGATGQTHMAENNGYYWTIVTLNGCSSERSEPLFVIVEGIPTVEDAGLTVSPVPNQGAFHLSLTAGGADEVDIRVIGVLGGVIREERGILKNGVLEKDIDLRPVEGGVYTLILTSRSGKWVRKIVVTR
ncbi:MAG TPA: hypothetical protein PKG48_13770, partial [Bacteroidales bacterium]|nr:hypothetical protein [Bacteroidales bacterium]